MTKRSYLRPARIYMHKGRPYIYKRRKDSKGRTDLVKVYLSPAGSNPTTNQLLQLVLEYFMKTKKKKTRRSKRLSSGPSQRLTGSSVSQPVNITNVLPEQGPSIQSLPTDGYRMIDNIEQLGSLPPGTPGVIMPGKMLTTVGSMLNDALTRANVEKNRAMEGEKQAVEGLTKAESKLTDTEIKLKGAEALNLTTEQKDRMAANIKYIGRRENSDNQTRSRLLAALELPRGAGSAKKFSDMPKNDGVTNLLFTTDLTGSTIAEIITALTNAHKSASTSTGSGAIIDPELGMTNIQIDELMEPYRRSGFMGVISADQIKMLANQVQRRQRRVSFIMNLDPSDEPGSHWVAVYICKRPDWSLEYFDPLADEPSKQFSNDISSIVGEMDPDVYLKFKVNRIRVQEYDTTTCGMHSVRFLMERYNNVPWRECTGYDALGEKKTQRLADKLPKYGYA